MEALEDDRWEPLSFASSLVVACHELRQKPVGELNAGELRVLIGQGIGLEHLVTLALDVLEREPLVEGRFYPGDLLQAVLAIDSAFWASRSELEARASDIASSVQALADSLAEDVLPTVAAFQRSR